MPELNKTIEEILAFRDERNWKQFHTPRNLAAAIAIEAGELQEAMLWKTDNEVEQQVNTAEGKASVESEVADVLIFTLLLCHALSIDPLVAIRGKLNENRRKYPPDLARDNATKYTKLR